MKKIIISPFSQKLNNKKNNPKNYPFWVQLIVELKKKGYYIIQIGRTGEEQLSNVDEVQFDLKLKDIENLIKECNNWISVDSFLPHLASHLNKPGIVLFSQSDRRIFGYNHNINLLKDEKYLRTNQFFIWEQAEYNEDAFVEPEIILSYIE